MANTDHDEELIRASWHGCEWLGVESMHNEPRGKPREVLRNLPEVLRELGVEEVR